MDTVQPSDLKEESAFWSTLEQWIEKIDIFYKKKEAECVKRLQEEIKPQVAKGKATEDFIFEFSNMVELLREYVVLNTIAFIKIIKKHDKQLQWVSNSNFVQEKVYTRYFYKSNVLEELESKLHQLLVKATPRKHQPKKEVAQKLIQTQQQVNDQQKGSSSAVMIHADDFRIKDLQRGKIHHIWVHLVENKFAQPICVPLLVACGKRSGPIFGITAALHGNEVSVDDHH